MTSPQSVRGGVLSEVSLSSTPFLGEIFRAEDLSPAGALLEEGRVRIVAANLQGRFAGVFGQIDLSESERSAEVSVVIQKTAEGD